MSDRNPTPRPRSNRKGTPPVDTDGAALAVALAQQAAPAAPADAPPAAGPAPQPASPAYTGAGDQPDAPATVADAAPAPLAPADAATADAAPDATPPVVGTPPADCYAPPPVDTTPTPTADAAPVLLPAMLARVSAPLPTSAAPTATPVGRMVGTAPPDGVVRVPLTPHRLRVLALLAAVPDGGWVSRKWLAARTQRPKGWSDTLGAHSKGGAGSVGLCDAGLVDVRPDGNGYAYRITDAGRALLAMPTPPAAVVVG